MTVIDLRSRFSKTDDVETPDVWQEIEARSERIVGGAAPRLSDASELRPGSRRWLTMAVALILGVGAVGAVVVAFSDVDNHRTPLRSPSAGATPTHELTGTAKITATISLPEGTIGGGVAVGSGSVWTGLNDSHGRDGAVIRIDPATNEIVATIAVAQGPGRKRIAATDDAVWVASTGLLQRIDPATNSVVASVEIPARSISAITADSSDVWAVTIDADGGVLVRIDTATNAIVAEIPLGSQITGYEDAVQIGAGSVWVIGVTWIERENAEYGSDLIRVDPATNTVAARIPVGGFRMAVGPDAVWVTFPADGAFDTSGEHWLWTKVDLGNNEASPPFRLQAASLELVTAEGLWSVDYDEQEYVRVTRFDPLTLSVESRSEPVRSYFHDALLDPASGTVWVSTLNSIVRLDIS
jgi:hypothetical protein